MLMEHLLCDDAGGKYNVCGMTLLVLFLLLTIKQSKYLDSFF